MNNLRQSFLAFIFVMLIDDSQCFPSHPGHRTPPAKMLYKEEKQLENGTIVGKYSYFDKEGGAVGVKYFADKEGYGVELKSLKISTMQPDKLKELSKGDKNSDELSPLVEIIKTFNMKYGDESTTEKAEVEEVPAKKDEKKKNRKNKSSIKGETQSTTSFEGEETTEKSSSCYKNKDYSVNDVFVDRKRTPKKYYKEMCKSNKRNNRNTVCHNDDLRFCDQV